MPADISAVAGPPETKFLVECKGNLGNPLGHPHPDSAMSIGTPMSHPLMKLLLSKHISTIRDYQLNGGGLMVCLVVAHTRNEQRNFHSAITVPSCIGWGSHLFRRFFSESSPGITAAAMLPKQSKGTFRKHIKKPSEQVAAPPSNVRRVP